MKKSFIVLTILGIVLIGSCVTTFIYLNKQNKEEYKNGVFVNGGRANGYTTMYCLR